MDLGTGSGTLHLWVLGDACDEASQVLEGETVKFNAVSTDWLQALYRKALWALRRTSKTCTGQLTQQPPPQPGCPVPPVAAPVPRVPGSEPSLPTT